MMVALGVASDVDLHTGLGYMASMFHLFTHAMFKALLFLGAGCIIHAVHSNEMSEMGNLRKYMPVTHITFLIACLAIAGIPPFSGFFSKDEFKTFRQLHGMLQGHPDMKKIPGVDASTGSLGQGISLAVGMALGAKHMGKDTRVYTILGDGECQEGQVWEAFMAASHYKLDNLTVVIDNNGLQIDGPNDEVMSLGDMAAKLRAFGFHLVELSDGNDLEQVLAALNEATEPGKPKAILAHTVKGKGATFADGTGAHSSQPSKEQWDEAIAHAEKQLAEIKAQ